MRRVSSFLTALVIVAATASCESADVTSNLASADRRAGDVLVLGTADGPMLVDAVTAEPLGDGTATLTAPDGSRVYTSTSDGGTTSVVTRDTATGDVVAETEVGGRFDVRVASVSGDAVALMEPLPDGVHPWTPLPRASTTIVVADPSGVRPAQRLRLDGNFEPEAFSTDDQNLFLIEHLPAEAPTAYRVTFLDLGTGEIRPVKGRFKVPPQRMPGTRLRQVFDPVKAQLYTLYTNEARTAGDAWDDGGDAYGSGGGSTSYASYGDDASGGGDAAGDDVDVTFVHVLNLRGGWAFCAGVPRALWGQAPRALALATSPNGALLYIVDSVGGLVSEMDTKTLEIVRTTEVDLGSGDGVRTSAQVSADGRRLFVGSASDGQVIRVLDTATLEPLARWELGSAVHDLDLSADGARLYAALDDAIALLDPDDGSEAGRLALGGVEEIVHVATPARG